MALGMNDVNLDSLKATDQLIRQNPAIGKCQFKAKSTWLRGTKVQVSVGEWTAGGQNMAAPPRRFTIMVDEPELLGGVDGGPNPVEVLLSALCGCVTLGTATNAAMFGVPIEGIEIEMEADIDARGMLGHDKKVRNGVTDIRYTITIQSSAPEDKVRQCKETIDRKSPVRDTLANPVNITSRLLYKPR
jgi:putative redox protein